MEFLSAGAARASEHPEIAHGAPWLPPPASGTVRPPSEPIPRPRGALRCECLDHVIVLGERHLRRVLASYMAYYHGARTHLSLEKDSPTPRRIQTPTEGRVVAFAEAGGLH